MRLVIFVTLVPLSVAIGFTIGAFFKIHTYKKTKPKRREKKSLYEAIAMLIVAVLGFCASGYFSLDLFLQDFETVQGVYQYMYRSSTVVTWDTFFEVNGSQERYLAYAKHTDVIISLEEAVPQDESGGT